MSEGITIEIFEGDGGTLEFEDGKIKHPENIEEKGICAWMYRGDGEKSYQQGQIFKYPDDIGKICPWLMDSMNSFIRVMRFGGYLGWRYEGTPYAKQIDQDGITTEFVRCPDPTKSGVVVKITLKEKAAN